MTLDLALRVLALCVAFASAETLHGIARTMLVVPRIGKERALKLSILTGSALAFGVCYFFLPGLGLSSVSAHLYLGLFLALFMAGFDAAMGRLLLRRSWAKVATDFDPRSGNLLVLGLAFLAVCPVAVRALRGAP